MKQSKRLKKTIKDGYFKYSKSATSNKKEEFDPCLTQSPSRHWFVFNKNKLTTVKRNNMKLRKSCCISWFTRHNNDYTNHYRMFVWQLCFKRQNDFVEKKGKWECKKIGTWLDTVRLCFIVFWVGSEIINSKQPNFTIY